MTRPLLLAFALACIGLTVVWSRFWKRTETPRYAGPLQPRRWELYDAF